MFGTTRYTVLAAIAGMAILSMVAGPGLMITNNNIAAAQTPPSGNATTVTPPGNATSASSARMITLTPTSGSTGSNVTIDGTGFSTGQTFGFTFDGKYIYTNNMTQNTMGGFSIIATIPRNATAGDHEIKAAGSKGENATATFAVQESGNATSSTGNATSTAPSGNETSTTPVPPGNETSSSSNSTLTAPAGNATATGNSTAIPGVNIATLVLTPASVSAGSELSIAGSGFGSNQNVTLALNDNPLTSNSTITTDATGAFTTTVAIPKDVAAGDHKVSAKDGSGVEASATLSVTAATMPPSAPPP
jgi:hypothetical protein